MTLFYQCIVYTDIDENKVSKKLIHNPPWEFSTIQLLQNVYKLCLAAYLVSCNIAMIGTRLHILVNHEGENFGGNNGYLALDPLGLGLPT